MLSLWTTFDLGSLSADVTSALSLGVSILVMFLAYKFIRRVANDIGGSTESDYQGEIVHFERDGKEYLEFREYND